MPRSQRDLGDVLHPLGARRAQRRERLSHVAVGGRRTHHEARLAVAANRLLQHARQHRVAKWHVILPTRSARQRVDHVAQRQQRRVDLLCLRQRLPLCPGAAYVFGASQVAQRERGLGRLGLYRRRLQILLDHVHRLAPPALQILWPPVHVIRFHRILPLQRRGPVTTRAHAIQVVE